MFVNAILATLGLFVTIGVYVWQVVTYHRDDRVEAILDGSGNPTGKEDKWHRNRFVTSAGMLLAIVVLLWLPLPSPSDWWDFAIGVVLVVFIIACIALTMVDWPANNIGTMAIRWTHGPLSDPSDPSAGLRITDENKRPAFRARRWAFRILAIAIVLAWIVSGILWLTANPTDAGTSPEAAPSSKVTATAAAPTSKSAPSAAPTTDAPKKAETNKCDAPKLDEVNETSALYVRDYRVTVCKDGKWVRWTGAAPAEVEVNAKLTTPEYKYFEFVTDGTTFVVRYAYTLAEKSPAPTTGA